MIWNVLYIDLIVVLRRRKKNQFGQRLKPTLTPWWFKSHPYAVGTTEVPNRIYQRGHEDSGAEDYMVTYLVAGRKKGLTKLVL